MILTYSNSAPTLGIAAHDADEVIKGNIKKLYEDVYPNYIIFFFVSLSLLFVSLVVILIHSSKGT